MHSAGSSAGGQCYFGPHAATSAAHTLSGCRMQELQQLATVTTSEPNTVQPSSALIPDHRRLQRRQNIHAGEPHTAPHSVPKGVSEYLQYRYYVSKAAAHGLRRGALKRLGNKPLLDPSTSALTLCIMPLPQQAACEGPLGQTVASSVHHRHRTSSKPSHPGAIPQTTQQRLHPHVPLLCSDSAYSLNACFNSLTRGLVPDDTVAVVRTSHMRVTSHNG